MQNKNIYLRSSFLTPVIISAIYLVINISIFILHFFISSPNQIVVPIIGLLMNFIFFSPFVLLILFFISLSHYKYYKKRKFYAYIPLLSVLVGILPSVIYFITLA